MRQFLKGLKMALYLLTIIPPVINAVKGAIEGIKKGVKDVELEKDMELERKFREDRERILRGDQ